MDTTHVRTLARVLKILVTITFVCNLLVLPLVPGLVAIGLEGGMEAFWTLTPYENALEVPLRVVVLFLLVCWQALPRIWREASGGMLTLFLWFCGVCTAVILWQGRRVLDTILRGLPSAGRTQAICAGRRCAASALRRPPWSGWRGACGISSPSGRC